MVSAPKVPSNSALQVGGRGAQGELLVDGQALAGVAGGHDDLSWSFWVRDGVHDGVQAGDAVGELVDDGVERGRIVGGHGVGDRPVQPRPPDRPARGAGGEFFVGVVADGHDQVGGVEDVVGRGGAVRAPGRGVGGGRRRPRRDAPAVRVGCLRRWPGPGCGRSTSRRPAASGPSCGCTRTPPAAPPERHELGCRRSRTSRLSAT